MQTVEQYLQGIEDKGIRTRALRNMDKEKSGDQVRSLEHALFWAFRWHRAPELFAYWKAVHHNVKYPADQMPVPKIK